MGFPHVDDDARVFTDRDLAALRTAQSLRTTGLVDDALLVALTRSMAQSLSRLAAANALALSEFVGNVRQAPSPAGLGVSATTAESLVADVSQLVDYVWRRHLTACATDVLTTAGQRRAGELHAGDVQPTAIGFADLVGFTELSRQLSTAELAEVVEAFEELASRTVSELGGRVIKTLGDAILFSAPEIETAAETALRLVERHAATPLLPELRVGLAYGPVLARLGDVFGEVVNIASRLTSVARPGTVLVDREAANALRPQPEWQVSALHRRHVRGYAHLAPYALRRP